MEQKQNCCELIYDELPPLSPNYPWFVAQNGEDDTEVHILFTAQDPFSHCHCRIPELLGKHIWGSFHGWLVLSTGIMWSLWNPLTSKIISLPPMILKDGDEISLCIRDCCLSSPPDDPDSILLLTYADKHIFVYCKVNSQGESLSWTKLSYYKQVMKITGRNYEVNHLRPLIYSNGKVYAQTLGSDHVLQVAIEVKGRDVEINLLPISQLPLPSFIDGPYHRHYLRGSITGLFDIVLGFKDYTYTTVSVVQLFKLDIGSMKWEEMNDLKETIITVSHSFFYSAFYSHAIVSSDLGGYIHILGDKGKTINSYHVKDKTITESSMPCLVGTENVSAWPLVECRLEAHHADHKQKEEDKDAEIRTRLVKDDEVEFNSSTNDESHLLNLPFHILEMIMKFCVGAEYLKFRATCKCCHLAAPLVQWINEESLERLQTYTSVSPWMIVFDMHQGIITLTDLMFGDKYYIKTPKQLISDIRMYDSKHGWLLMHVQEGHPVFYNPFTSDIRELPSVPFLENLSFSAPPTSPDCIVVGFTSYDDEWYVYIHFVAREPNWRKIILNFSGDSPFDYSFPTFFDGDLYALCDDGELHVFKNLHNHDFSWYIACDAPTSRCTSEKQYFLVKCDQNFLLIIVGKFGESIELFELNVSTEKWEKIDGLGRHTVYISDTRCICTEAQTPYLENKIYFPRLHSENGNLVFYSLETRRYHTSDGKNVRENFGNFFRTKHHLAPLSWIEPSWS